MRSSDGKNRRGERRTGSRRPEAPDHRRLTLAVEAARIIQEEGLTDFRGAKAKAAQRLGMGRNAVLPNNEEIEAALAERTRIFHSDSHPELLDALRHAAVENNRDLAPFHPRLVGDVLSGNATVHSNVDLHLFSDTVEAVGSTLEQLGIGHRVIARRFRLRRDEFEPFPGYRFSAHDCDFTGTVFPLRMRGHAPLSPVDGRPMQRANAKELAELLKRGTKRGTGP
ncbi:MAG: hypothetical protein Q8N51_00525 [Gammaproteobacteria bacterium]|nr:hypothetical protein [Gammaproteobacteria bacterium]